jgi:predicted RNase H-like nuclease (RuvC/YqgF family)
MADQQNTDEVIEAEVVVEDGAEGEGEKGMNVKVATDGSDQTTALLSLEELIKNHIESIDKMREEVRQVREMFEDSFGNDPVFREHTERAKKASKEKNSVRQQIVKQPSVATLAQKIKDLRFDMSEQTKTLSDLLQDYHEQTGATQIEARNGQLMEIVSTAKLVRKNTKYNP